MTDGPAQTTESKALIQQAFDDWAEGTGGVLPLLAHDATWTIVGGSPVSRTYRSRQEFMDVVTDTWYLTLHDGKIIEAVAFFDTIELTHFRNRVSPGQHR